MWNQRNTPRAVLDNLDDEDLKENIDLFAEGVDSENEQDEQLEAEEGKAPLALPGQVLPSTSSARTSGERLQVSGQSPAATSSNWPGQYLKLGEDYHPNPRRASAPASPGFRSRSRSPHEARNLSTRQILTPLPTGMVNQSGGEDTATRSVGESVLTTSSSQPLSPVVMNERGRSRRGMGARVRGGYRGRGNITMRGARGVPRARQARSERRVVGRRVQKWQVGDPLVEVFTHDDDVDPHVLSIVENDERRCEQIMRESTAKRRAVHDARRDIIEENDSETKDDNDGVSGTVDGGEGEVFRWLPSSEAFLGVEENLRVDRTGAVDAHDSPYSAFRCLWPEELVNHIVSETNLYAARLGGRNPTFAQTWYDTNADEILCLFAFWMMLGIIQMPSINECFSTDPLTRTDVFRKLFTKDRYKKLSRAVHFVETTDAGAAEDRMHRLRPIISSLNSTFQNNYILDKDICIDESLTLWKGCLNIKQYIRSKAVEFGVKSFELCESSTGYLWAFRYYTGKLPSLDNLPADVNKSTSVVMELMRPLLNKGYTLYMDNCYNSLALARWLKQNGTDCVGTLCLSHDNVPRLFSRVQLSRGQFIARHSGDVFLLSWQDKKRITTLSTYHQNHTAEERVWSKPPNQPAPHKPHVVLDCNRCMGGVDMKDQMLEPYSMERTCGNKWHVKLFKHLVNCSILNSRTIYLSSTGKIQPHLAFRKQLVREIMGKHLSNVPRPRSRQTAHASVSRAMITQPIPNRHWPENIPNRLRCVVCYHIEHRSHQVKIQCSECKMPLCPGCFKTFHTNPVFTSYTR